MAQQTNHTDTQQPDPEAMRQCLDLMRQFSAWSPEQRAALMQTARVITLFGGRQA